MGGMGIIKIVNAKEKLLKRSSSSVKKGHFAVYVGETQKRYIIPISTLNHPLFRELLHWVEQEFGFRNSSSDGHLTIPCNQDYFEGLISLINRST